MNLPGVLCNDGIKKELKRISELSVGFTLGKDVPEHVGDVKILASIHVQQVI